METLSEIELHAAIQHLYTTFVNYPLKDYIWGCECCVSSDNQARIRSKPLRDLTEYDLSRYSFKAMTTWGDSMDFRHFLPRLFENLAYASYSYDNFILLGKLEYGHWRTWPVEEQQAIQHYLLVLWNRVLAAFPPLTPNFFSASDALMDIGLVFEDLTLFLATWRQNLSVDVLRHLAQFIDDNVSYLVFDQEGISWYRAHWQQIKSWLLDSRTCQILEEAFFRWYDEPFAHEFMLAHDRLYALIY